MTPLADDNLDKGFNRSHLYIYYWKIMKGTVYIGPMAAVMNISEYSVIDIYSVLW